MQVEDSGALASRGTSSDESVQLAHIDKAGGYLLLAARWFPLTDFPANRYTGVFQIEVPGTMTVAGTGTSTAPTSVTPKISATPAIGNSRSAAPLSPSAPPPPPSMANEPILYTFSVQQPEAPA